MTTSYENETDTDGRTGNVSATPTYNAEGHQVWNPSVGVYHKPAKDQRESYGGIIGALQDLDVQQTGGLTKAYPHNFAGIIAAIKDLKVIAAGLPPVYPGPGPDGGEIIIDIDGNPSWEITRPPRDGELWFDTRQGRLFVAVDQEWHQTNGADGIPYVTDNAIPPSVATPVPGQMWWDSAHNTLYIFDGKYQLADDSFVDIWEPGAAPVWKLISTGSEDNFQTTYTLPLGALGPKLLEAEDTSDLDFTYLPVLEPTEFSVQSDYNVWLFDALKSLDDAIADKGDVSIGELPPDTPVAGQLWYDTESLELSIWYEDDDSGQWVPTSTPYMYDEDLDTLRASIEDEARIREQSVHNLYELIEAIQQVDHSEITELEVGLAELLEKVNNLPEHDLSPYARASTLATYVDELQQDINQVANDLADLPDYALQTEVTQINSQLTNFATKDEVVSVEQSIPDVSEYVTASDITNAIDNITTEYLPRTGGTLTGSFILNKQDYELPGLDFSTALTDSKNVFKFKTLSPTNSDYVTFGTNENFWEYAWNFSSEEDFRWVYNNDNAVFSITKDGPACSTLYLGDIGDTSTNGRVIHNKIDLKERLDTYQTAFEQMRQGIADADDFETLKANLLSALASV